MTNTGVIAADQTSISATVSGHDRNGNPASFPPGVTATWTLVNPIATMTISADTFTATFTGPFTVGSSEVDVSADGLSATGTLTVTPAGVVSIVMDFSAAS